MRLEKLLGLGVVFVVLAIAASSQIGPVGVAQADCTVTVKPGESIQKAIDEAKAGAVVCLTAGTWQENVVIEKSLTLRGEKEKTVIDGVQSNYPVIWVGTPEQAQVVVQVEGLKVTGAEVWFIGSAPGVLLWGTAQVTIANSTISENEGNGIELRDSTRATISHSTVSGNRLDGVFIWNSAQATISHSIISGNRSNGIQLWNSAQAIISDNLVQNNQGCGILSTSSKEVRGEANKMSDNGNDLCGNLPGSLRLPLREPTEREITWPDERYKSLQEAVDALWPKGRLQLKAGEHQAGVTITKELRVEAEEGGKVTLMAKSEKAPVLSLVGGAREVKMRGVRISKGEVGLSLCANAQVTIFDSAVSGNQGGIKLRDSAQATISNSTVSGNEGHGIVLEHSARAAISDSIISENWDGIQLWHSAQATISSSTLSENRWHGIELEDSAQVTISGSTVSKNRWDGIQLWRSAQATISGSTVSENGWGGIRLGSSAIIERSTLQGNGTDPDCKELSKLCNGLTVGGDAVVELRDSRILESSDWGIAVMLKQCGYDWDNFTGKVVFEGTNTIEGNNTSGNQNGMGNPGNHPWNQPNVPDGQVCLR
jgi:parallel beta-helix repeat protein